MNPLLDALLLGAIQGITEFLPISSSGHLAIGQKLLGEPASLAFIAVIHLGTLAAAIVYFWRDLIVVAKSLAKKDGIAWKIVAASIPGVIGGLLLSDFLEEDTKNITAVSLEIIATGIILLLTEWALRRDATKKKTTSSEKKPWDKLSYADAVLIGLGQMVALIPGISRSGTTIAAGLLRGFSREGAVRFSFLMSIPIIAGGSFLALFRLLDAGLPTGEGTQLIAGSLAAFVFGILSIQFLLKLVRKGTFLPYGIYAVVIGLAAVVWQQLS